MQQEKENLNSEPDMSSVILYDIEYQNKEDDEQKKLHTIKRLIVNNGSIAEIKAILAIATRQEDLTEVTILESAMKNNRLDIMELIMKTDISYIFNINIYSKDILELAFDAPRSLHDLFFNILASLDNLETRIDALFHPTKQYINSKLISIFTAANKMNLVVGLMKAQLNDLYASRDLEKKFSQFSFRKVGPSDILQFEISQLETEVSHLDMMIALDQKYYNQNCRYHVKLLMNEMVDKVIIGESLDEAII